jgi:DNA polymerase-3 subunit chi
LTEVEFHTGVADRAGFACRLLRKAYRQGARVLVTAPADVLAEVDRLLWTVDERDFVPHVRVPGAPAAVAARTPIWLAADTQQTAAAQGAPTVVLNLGAAAPASLGGVDRLIEVVSNDPGEADQGRSRWRAYKAAGLEIKHHGGAGSRD